MSGIEAGHPGTKDTASYCSPEESPENRQRRAAEAARLREGDTFGGDQNKELNRWEPGRVGEGGREGVEPLGPEATPGEESGCRWHRASPLQRSAPRASPAPTPLPTLAGGDGSPSLTCGSGRPFISKDI